jgi:hypothetical protein
MKKLIIGAYVILCICAGLLLFLKRSPSWQFDHLEPNARKVITATALQLWATDLLAAYPSNTGMSAVRLGTNFPAGLLGVYHRPGYVWIFGDRYSPPNYVRVEWGGGILGDTGFMVGGTDFIAHARLVHTWAPGVYFFKEW